MMNKSILTTIFVFLVGISFSQLPPIDPTTNKFTFNEKVKADSLKAAEIGNQVKKWAKAKGLEEKEVTSSKFSYNGSVEVSYPGTKGGVHIKGKVTYNIQVDVKDGKYRIIVTDFVHEEIRGSGGALENESPECGSRKLLPKSWLSIKRSTNAEIKKLINDLKQTIKEFENDPRRNDDW